MRFQATSNHYVRCVSPIVKRAVGKKGFYFDENGIFETENPTLIKVLSQNFPAFEEPIKELPTLRHCKKCDFVCESQGQLLQHYRTHKKEGT